MEKRLEKRCRVLVSLCCVLALACVGLGLEYGRARREIERLEREKGRLTIRLAAADRRRRIAEGLACRGDAPPLADGELFALGMRDYWQCRMRRVWKLWEENPVTRANCGPGRDGCYPWRLPEYATLEQLKTGLRKITGYYPKDEWLHQARRPGELYYETIVRVVLRGHAHHPESGRMYLPEHADGGADFGVLHNIGEWTHWYGAGCCRLLTHAEATAESRGMTGRLGKDAEDMPPGKSLKDLRYLRIQKCTVDSNIPPGTAGVRYFAHGSISGCHVMQTDYFLLSACGEILFE